MDQVLAMLDCSLDHLDAALMKLKRVKEGDHASEIEKLAKMRDELCEVLTTMEDNYGFNLD